MSFQLTYSRAGESHAESLKRKETRLVDETSSTLHVTDGKNGKLPVATITQGKDGRYSIAPIKGASLTMNGKPLEDRTRIMSGDTIRSGDQLIRFYAVLPPARLSWQSKMLTVLAKLSLGVLFILQLLFMFWIPWRLSDSHVWDGAAAKQKITQTIDTTRQRVTKILKQEEEKEIQTPSVIKLLVSEIALDLEERSAYFRTYETRLSRSQRRRMVEDLAKINSLLDDIDNGLTFPEIPKPDIDNAVRAITDKYSN